MAEQVKVKAWQPEFFILGTLPGKKRTESYMLSSDDIHAVAGV